MADPHPATSAGGGRVKLCLAPQSLSTNTSSCCTQSIVPDFAVQPRPVCLIDHESRFALHGAWLRVSAAMTRAAGEVSILCACYISSYPGKSSGCSTKTQIHIPPSRVISSGTSAFGCCRPSRLFLQTSVRSRTICPAGFVVARIQMVSLRSTRK